MCAAKVYRSRWMRGLVVLSFGFFFSVIGVLNFERLDPCAGVALFAVCLAGNLIGINLLAMRVVVTNTDVSKVPRWLGGFSVSWQEVDRWFVASTRAGRAEQDKLWGELYGGEAVSSFPKLLDGEDSFTFRAVVFKIRGRPNPLVVYDSEAFRPSFDEFVADVRLFAADKECGLST